MNQFFSLDGFKKNGWFMVFSFFALLHLSIVILNHSYFRTFAYDYGVYNFAFFDFAHFQVSPCTVYHKLNDVSFLQDHFSLTLPILSPLYWVFHWFTGTYLLLMLQWVFVMGGAYFTHKFVLLKSGNSWIALFSLIYYFVLYNRFSAYQSDCNLAIIGASVLPVFLYYFEVGKRLPAILAFIFMVLNREDFSMTLIFLSLFLMILHRQEKQKFRSALWFFMSSVAAFLIIFQVLIPLLETDTKKFSLFNYSVLGQTPAEALAFMFKHPVETLKLLFINHSDDVSYNNVKITFYVVFVLSGGIFLFFRPVYLICMIPLIAKKMFNDFPMRWSHDMYYAIEIMCLLPIFVFSIISDLKSTSLKMYVSAMVCVLTMCVTYYCIMSSNNSGLGHIKYDVLNKDFYKPPQNFAGINIILKEIPPNASVSATGGVLPHLAMRKKIYLFPKMEDADYFCIKSYWDSYPVSREELAEKVNSLVKSGQWSVILASGECMLLKKNR